MEYSIIINLGKLKEYHESYSNEITEDALNG